MNKFSVNHQKQGRFIDFVERAIIKISHKINWIRGSLNSIFFAQSQGDVYIGPNCFIRGRRYIHCLGRFIAMRRNRIEAYDRHRGERFSPKIIFGANVSIEDDCHIAAVNCIKIGNNVLIASKVYISDHSHGPVSLDQMLLPPYLRPIVSVGPIEIGDNVWIGEGVAILAGVRIGHGSIIGANAVVTRDIPPCCSAAGVPARVLNKFELN
jgi:acetyltransferase-like isoleucine patch superfamily enzyme